MIWKTNSHIFTATLCRHTGRTCPALARMAEKLAQAMDKAKPVTTEDFEIEGNSTLKNCPHACSARFRASHERIRIFCDVGADEDGNRLDQFADTLLSPEAVMLPAGWLAQPPCALLEAVPLGGEHHASQHTVSL